MSGSIWLPTVYLCVFFDMFYKHFLLTTFCSFKHIEPIRMNIKTNQINRQIPYF